MWLLENKLSLFDIDIADIEVNNESLTAGGIRSQWGPAQFSLAVWE